MHVNLFVKIGRAAKSCVGTFETVGAAASAQDTKAAELAASGVAPDRIEFSSEVVGASQAKKGRK